MTSTSILDLHLAGAVAGLWLGPCYVAPASSTQRRKNRRFRVAFHKGVAASCAPPPPGLEGLATQLHAVLPIVPTVSGLNECSIVHNAISLSAPLRAGNTQHESPRMLSRCGTPLFVESR